MKTVVTSVCAGIACGIINAPAFAEQNNNLNAGLRADADAVVQQEFADYVGATSGPQASRVGNPSGSPAISIILDAGYANYGHSGGEAELPGFFLGAEAGTPKEGFALGHTEIVASADIDRHFYGKAAIAIAEHDGETEVELEEAYVETIGLGEGFTIRGGRFFSAVGYINQQHQHAWDFIDAPLVYRGLWGRVYSDDGLRVSWVAPSTTFVEVGVEALSGRRFPAKSEGKRLGSRLLFANVGGDFDDSNAWQAGFTVHDADVVDRDAGSHDHDGGATETPSFTGDSRTYGLSAIYKWAPNGNYKDTHFKLQAEYFYRAEDGDLVLEGSDPLEQTDIKLRQSGFYLQGVYQFDPEWSASIRYDGVTSDAEGRFNDLLDEAELIATEDSSRTSTAISWMPSEYSRVRLQYNRDSSTGRTENQFFLQFTYSIGAHGAHKF